MSERIEAAARARYKRINQPWSHVDWDGLPDNVRQALMNDIANDIAAADAHDAENDIVRMKVHPRT